MNRLKKQIWQILDEIEDAAYDNTTEPSILIDTLISALELALPNIFRNQHFEQNLSSTVDHLVKRNLIDANCQPVAEKIQELLELGDYPNRIEDDALDKLNRLLRTLVTYLKDLEL